jgi:Ca2+-binding RTX toxin-like protein
VLEIRDASVIEGDSGLRTMELVIALSSPVDRAVRVGWATSPSTATPGAGTIIFPEDYRTASGTARIVAGATETVVRVPVGGDLVAEGDETLFVDLSAPVNAVIGDGHAVGTILDGGDVCTIVGTNGDDVLVGTDGDDVLCGLRGNDRYDPRGGDDRLIDPAGVDMLTYELAPNGVVIDLAAGEATGWGTDRFASIEHATGSAHDDVLAGTDAANDLTGLEGDDRLVGLGGPDDLLGGAGADDIDGGGGNDIVIGGDGADVISGALGADVLSGDSGTDTMSGGDGSDLLLGGPADQLVSCEWS